MKIYRHFTAVPVSRRSVKSLTKLMKKLKINVKKITYSHSRPKPFVRYEFIYIKTRNTFFGVESCANTYLKLGAIRFGTAYIFVL